MKSVGDKYLDLLEEIKNIQSVGDLMSFNECIQNSAKELVAKLELFNDAMSLVSYNVRKIDSIDVAKQVIDDTCKENNLDIITQIDEIKQHVDQTFTVLIYQDECTETAVGEWYLMDCCGSTDYSCIDYDALGKATRKNGDWLEILNNFRVNGHVEHAREVESKLAFMNDIEVGELYCNYVEFMDTEYVETCLDYKKIGRMALNKGVVTLHTAGEGFMTIDYAKTTRERIMQNDEQ